MSVLALALALALLQSPAPGSAKALAGAAKPGCRMGLIAELPVTFERNRPTVEVQVDGKPLRALLDIGADTSTIAGPAAKRIGLAVRQLSGRRIRGFDGTANAYVAHIEHLTLMGETGPPFDISVNAAPFGSGVDMLLGRDLLLATDLELDLGHGKVRLIRPNGCADDQMAYWSDRYSEVGMVEGMGDEVRVQVRVNGVYVVAMLDSGAQRSVSSDAVAFRASVPLAPADPKNMLTGVSGRQVPVRTGVVKRLDVGDEALSNVQVSFGPMDLQDSFTHGRMQIVAPVEMLLGADFLKAHRLLIVKETSKIYFTYNGGPVFRTDAASSPPSPPPAAEPPASGKQP